MPFAIEPSAEVAARVDFPQLCDARGIKFAVEIGVEQGVYAAQFLKHWHGESLILVDDYGDHEENPGDRTFDMLTAALALAPHHGRYRFIRLPSVEAAARFPAYMRSWGPRFFYLDAAHDFDNVWRDLNAWWPLVPEDGILAGHDFDNSHPGVVQAVTAFAQREQLRVYLTTNDGLPSWYVYRREPERLFHRFFRDGSSKNPNYH